MKFYWYRFRVGFPVTYHLRRDFTTTWSCVRGVQIGPWFIGAVKGNRVDIAVRDNVSEKSTGQ